jgi:hypothetical protein
MKRTHLAISVAAFAVIFLAGCGGNDDARATSVQQTTAPSASETMVLPPEQTATSEIETEVSGGYASTSERQARFDVFYNELASRMSLALAQGSQGFFGEFGAYGVANGNEPDCFAPHQTYDNQSEALVIACTADGKHAVVQFFGDNGEPDGSKQTVSFMLEEIVVASNMPGYDGYYIAYPGADQPKNASLAELKQYDDVALALLKDTTVRYFDESISSQIGVA